MNRAERRRQDWIRRKSDVEPAPWMTDDGIPDKVKADFLGHIQRTGRTPDKAYGIFGEQSGRDGWIEKIVKHSDGYFVKEHTYDPWKETEPEEWFPKEKGVFIKLYGCSYLFKGNVPKESVHGLEMAKTILFQTVPKLPTLTFIGLGLDFLFRRNKFWHFIDWMGDQINHRCLRHYNIPKDEYNGFARELLNAFNLAMYKVWGIDLTRPYIDPTRAYYTINSDLFRKDLTIPHSADNDGPKWRGYAIARLWPFIVFFLQQDYAYRARVQDALGEKPKNLEEFLKILMSRETAFGVGYKWKFIFKGVRGIMYLEPKIKALSNAFFEFVDTEKVKQDEVDRYFSLMYKSYDFGGLPKETRYRMWDTMNKEKGNVFLFHFPDVE